MSLPDEIHKLHAMLKAGALTTGEFEQRKQILLSGEYAGVPAAVAPDQPGPRQPESVLASGEYLVQVGAYKVLEKVGEGGMGVVYRARHTQSAVAQRQGGDVALKVLHEQLAKRPDFRERFDREADLGLRLNHRNVVKVHDLVIDGSRLALVMEWVEGRPLSKMIGEETGPLPWERAWPVFEQILDGLEHIHEAGIVHRDLKPENIMVTTDGRVKVLDLGIAKGEGERITKHGVKLGTVDYMAPEQYLDPSQVDHRADIYAVGMTLYMLLAGRLSWEDDTSEFQVMDLKRIGDVSPPTAFYPSIPPSVVEGVMNSIEVDMDHRPGSIAALRDQLGVFVSVEAIQRDTPHVRPAPPLPSIEPTGTTHVAEKEYGWLWFWLWVVILAFFYSLSQ